MITNIDWLNRLAKWRSVLAGWQLGTRTSEDPECQAVRDHREVSLLLRAEMNALVGMLIAKRVITKEEFRTALVEEAKFACEELEARFPGFSAVDNGMEADERIVETCKGWRP